MDEDEINQKWWSLESSDKSINEKFEDLHIEDDKDHTEDGNGMVARGNPIRNKVQYSCNKKLGNQKKPVTSAFVLPILQKDAEYNLELSKSSGYNSSISPSTEHAMYNFIPNSHQFPIDSNGIFQLNQLCPAIQVCNQSTKVTLKKLLKIRLSRKSNSKDGSDQFIFEFRDTNLIKSCRKGQLTGVQEALNELAKNHQLPLIDHQNAANETALSIATYQMNEPLIKLLLKNDASPNIPLTMRNNVLHIAASMVHDVERRTLKYLINAITYFQPESLLAAITDKNIFNYDVCATLMWYRDNMTEDPFGYQCLQNHICALQYMSKTFYVT